MTDSDVLSSINNFNPQYTGDIPKCATAATQNKDSTATFTVNNKKEKYNQNGTKVEN